MPSNLRQHSTQPAAAHDVSRLCRHTELLLNCARIGYNP
jgi:hypothetical protein